MTAMDHQTVKEYLPHRYPFLLIDKVLEIDPGKSIVAMKNLTANEEFFCGHLPQMAIMPGVLMIEALAQASGILTYKTLNVNAVTGSPFYFAGVNSARFKRMVKPGDQLKLEVEFLKAKLALWKFKGVASVDGEMACSCEFMIIRDEAAE